MNDGSFVAVIGGEVDRYAADGTYIGTADGIPETDYDQIEAYGAHGYMVTGSQWGGQDGMPPYSYALYLRQVNGDGTSLFTGDAPAFSDDVTKTIAEDQVFAFSKADFPFADDEGEVNAGQGDAFARVIITATPIHGTLTYNGHAVTAGQKIDVGDLSKLSFTPGQDDFGDKYARFRFKVVDDGSFTYSGSNTPDLSYTFTLNVTAVVDTFNGTAAADKILGTKDSDILKGLGGDDILRGKAGADQLDGGRGRDMLTGGGGADHFIFGARYSRDTVTDFHATGPGHDVIDLSRAVGIADYTDLISHHVQEIDGDLRITADDGAKLVLAHITARDLTAADFVF